MAITTTVQETVVDAVGSVVITDVTQDDAAQYVREIRVYGPTVSGNTPLVFTLRLSAAQQSSIELTAPAALF